MLALTVCTLVLSAYLTAAQTDLRPYDVTADNLFTNNDIDQDNDFSLDELRLSFLGYDANFDGVVSREEYTTTTAHQVPAMFVLTHALYDMYDMNEDGVLTEYDFSALFHLWDCNGNNIVSRQEFVHYWKTILTALDHLHHPDATFRPTTPPPVTQPQPTA